MSENIASSTSPGSRPSRSARRVYSSRVRPSSTPRAAWSGNEGAVKALEELQAVGAAGEGVDRVLGGRHEAEDIALGVAHAGDVVLGAVGVVAGGVAQDNLLLGHWLGGVEAAGRVLDRDREAVSARTRAGERRLRVDDLDLDLAADEAQGRVGQERAGQQARLAQDLKAVADAEHGAAVAGEVEHRRHHGREAGDRTHAEVVAVAEAARDDHGVDPAQVGVGVPEQLGVADAGGGKQGIALVARAGKANDAEPHAADDSGGGGRTGGCYERIS